MKLKNELGLSLLANVFASCDVISSVVDVKCGLKSAGRALSVR